MNWQDTLSEKLTALSQAEFEYIETKDVNRASKIDLNNSGIYMEATVVYFEIKNLAFMLKENGRRKVAQTYTMYHEIMATIAEQSGGFVNCFSPNAFLLIFPGGEDTYNKSTVAAIKVATAISQTYKDKFSHITGLEFAMGMDHGHIMGTKNLSDNNVENITWFGTCITKAICICQQCSRPFHVGVSGSIYHGLDESLRIKTRSILGIKKRIEIWTKVTYQYDNVKKHLYQTNHKISLDEKEPQVDKDKEE